MSISSIEIISDRIEAATKSSKIAIFIETNSFETVLNAVFDNTYHTRRRIRQKDYTYVGSFCGDDNRTKCFNIMRKALINAR